MLENKLHIQKNKIFLTCEQNKISMLHKVFKNEIVKNLIITYNSHEYQTI